MKPVPIPGPKLPPNNPADEPRQKIALADLKAVTETMAQKRESAGTFVRRMRDEDRY
jgi:hypothetical protein